MQLPPELRRGPFLVRDGIANGVSAERMRNRELDRPYWGIRDIQANRDVASRARAFALRMPPRAFYLGETAAALHGLPVARGSDPRALLHVGVPAGSRRVTAAGIHAHHIDIDPADLVTSGGVSLTSVERTWIDLAASGRLDLAHLVAVGDALLWRRDPRSSIPLLTSALDRYRGRRGMARLSSALPLLSDHADSPAESVLRVAIILAGLPSPVVNEPVVDSRGRFLATPDLSWPSRKVVLEYEGDHHRSDRRQWHIDLERYATLQDAGLTVVRAAAPDLRDPARIIARLRRLLQA